MKKIRVVICDSNPADAQYYEGLCRKLSREYNIPAELKSYKSINNLLFDLDNPLFRKKLDAVFLALSPESSIDAAISMRQAGYSGLIVFIGTAETNISYENLFDAEAFNFVRKGNEKENTDRFSDIFRKVADATAKARREKLAMSYAGEIRQIDIADIHYFEKQDRGLTVYYGNGEKFYFISSMTKLENQLKGRNFYRSSLSYLISLDAVQQVTSNEAVMRDGTKIPVGRQYYPVLKEAVVQKAVSI